MVVLHVNFLLKIKVVKIKVVLSKRLGFVLSIFFVVEHS